jgi:hypothetical protein
VSVTVGIGSIVAVGMVLLGMEPRLVLVAFVVMIVGAATWLTVDLGPLASRVVWTDHGRGTSTSARSDRRVQALRARLRSPARRRRVPKLVDTGRAEPADEIVSTLIDVIDDHLLAEYGIDRATEPAAAAAVLGADLTRFVTDPSARRSMSARRGLARTVGLIEDFCSRTHAA